MMKRVSLSHLKSTIIRRSGRRNSERTVNANGDVHEDCGAEENAIEEITEVEKTKQKVNEMGTANKSKRNILGLKTLRWKWRKKRASLLNSEASNVCEGCRPSEPLTTGKLTFRGFVPKKFRAKVPKSGVKRTVCPASSPIKCVGLCQNSSVCENNDDSTRPNDRSSSRDLSLGNVESNSAGVSSQGVTSSTLSHASSRNGLSVSCIKRLNENIPVPSSCDINRASMQDNPPTANLTRELFKLSSCGWYWGPVTRNEAEEKLLDQPDGAFLVRDSSDDRHLLSLSFRSFGRTLHTRIEHCNGMFSFYAHPEPEGHASIVELIEQSISYSQSGVFCYSRGRGAGSPSFPVRLTKPMSRFNQIRTLQYLCRFVIRQYTRFDHIQKLPLPGPIKGYLEEGHY